MNARRIPFQFSTTDPLARQKELEKRFGLQPTSQKMYVDVNNPLSMGTAKETSSPRLQHRVPIFAEGYNHPIYSSSVDSMASVPDKKPNVRVIPIEIEGADTRSPRQRNYSGPAGMVKDRCNDLASEKNGTYPFKKFHFEDLSKTQNSQFNAEPKVYNIPIKIEGVNDVTKDSKVDSVSKIKNITPHTNGCSQSKTLCKIKSEKDDKVKPEPTQIQVEQPKSTVETLLKKIDDVLTEFKTYETGVIEFSGTSKDKQYRYLDEMLTRCMLRLDDINTMGNEEIRLARKNAVKKIQASIDLLESKASVDTSTEIPEVQSASVENSATESDSVEMQEKDNVADSVENERSERIEMDCTVDDGGHTSNLPKQSDEVINEEENESKVESTEMKLEAITKNVEEIEMSKSANDLSNITDRAEDVTEDNSLKPQNSNMTEMEMAGDIPSAEVSSTNNAQLPEILSNSENKVKSEASDNVTSDVDMLDDKMISNVDEKTSSNSEQEENTSELTEIEMVEIENNSSKDSGEKIECETVDKTDIDSDFSAQKNDSTVPPIDTDMKDAPDASDISDKCVIDQSI